MRVGEWMQCHLLVPAQKPSPRCLSLYPVKVGHVKWPGHTRTLMLGEFQIFCANAPLSSGAMGQTGTLQPTQCPHGLYTFDGHCTRHRIESRPRIHGLIIKQALVTITMLSFLGSFTIALFSLFAFLVLRTLYTAFRAGIRQIPGPWLAKFTIFYRISMVTKGKGVQEYRQLHEEFGDVVRVGPNHVSVNDPHAIQQIYGISSKFRKVSLHVSLNPLSDPIQVRLLQCLSSVLRREAA